MSLFRSSSTGKTCTALIESNFANFGTFQIEMKNVSDANLPAFPLSSFGERWMASDADPVHRIEHRIWTSPMVGSSQCRAVPLSIAWKFPSDRSSNSLSETWGNQKPWPDDRLSITKTKLTVFRSIKSQWVSTRPLIAFACSTASSFSTSLLKSSTCLIIFCTPSTVNFDSRMCRNSSYLDRRFRLRFTFFTFIKTQFSPGRQPSNRKTLAAIFPYAPAQDQWRSADDLDHRIYCCCRRKWSNGRQQRLWNCWKWCSASTNAVLWAIDVVWAGAMAVSLALLCLHLPCSVDLLFGGRGGKFL